MSSSLLDTNGLFLYDLFMSLPSVRKILLILFVLILLIAIPATIYLVQKQQEAKTSSVPATNLTLTPGSQSATVGDDVNFDINMDPSTNQVSSVKILISYDATKLATDGAGFVPNITSFPVIVQGPTYEVGIISITLSTGTNAENTISTPTKIGTITFKTLDVTDTAPTQITFGNQTQVLSGGSGSQFNENVLSTTAPAIINISSNISPTPTLEPTISPTPASSSDSSALTPTPASSVIASSEPVCSSLTADRAPSGEAPYNINFTVIGESPDSTIAKVTYDFGDGRVQDVTQGTGTPTVNILQSHIYETAGIFTATATLTDANGAVSLVGSCSLVVTISQSATSSAIAVSPSPLPPSGPTQIIAIGIIGIVIAFIGALLLFAL